jgi:uncharacterized membrane protein required for colicin V production
VMSLTVLFWMYLILFAIIGAMRGWAKELLVMFSVVLAVFLITVLETYVGLVRDTIVAAGGTPLFWLRATLIILLVFFGYQTPNIRGLAGARFARERLQDTLLGFLLGAINGYLVVGTIWYFLHDAGYPFPVVMPPQVGDPYYDTSLRLLAILPPEWLTIPWIYFAVGLAFLFVIIVFI